MKKYFLLIALFVSTITFGQQTPIQVTARIDTNVYQNNQKKIRGDSVNAVLKAILNAYHIPPLLNNGVLAGGTVTWLHDYVYEVSPAVYVINDTLYTSPTISLTLDSADTTNDRIDLFVLTTSSTADNITGTASATPVEPDIDASIQLKISFALVQAGTTEPTIANEWIYQENAEWVYSDNTANLNPASTNNPYGGSTVDIEGTTVASGTKFTLTPATFPSLTNVNVVVFKIRSKAAWGNQRRELIQFMNGITPIGTAISLGNNVFGFNSGSLGSYQNITIPLAGFGNISTATALRFQASMTNGTIGFYIDDIQLTFIDNTPAANQVQVDWTQTNTALPSFILNKPAAPKLYVANLTQTGTSAPVVTVLINTLGGAVSWAYGGVGQYVATSGALFTTNKTAILISNNSDFGIDSYAHVEYNNNSTLTVDTYHITTTLQENDILKNCTLRIEVWP